MTHLSQEFSITLSTATIACKKAPDLFFAIKAHRLQATSLAFVWASFWMVAGFIFGSIFSVGDIGHDHA